MTTKLPILASIMRGANFYRFGETISLSQKPIVEKHGRRRDSLGATIGKLPPPMIGESRAEVADGLKRQTSHFDVQCAADIYWQQKSQLDLSRDFGSLRLPYPTAWFEWEAPGEEIPDEMGTNAKHCRYAGFLTQEENIVRCIAMVQPVSFDDIAPVVFMNEAPIDVTLDPETGEFESATQDLPLALEPFPDVKDMIMSDALTAMNTVAMALTLMSCKNVTTRRGGVVQVGRSGTAKRRGERPVEYHTIVLPGFEKIRGYSSRAVKERQDIMALHRVRGHFKTYTAEAPLMGKHVGRYWWGWNVRGNRKNGEIVADYKVKGSI